MATLSNLTVGMTYFLAATATDSTGLESVFSDELVFQVPSPPRPVLLLTWPAVAGEVTIVQSADLVGWVPLATLAGLSNSFAVAPQPGPRFFSATQSMQPIAGTNAGVPLQIQVVWPP